MLSVLAFMCLVYSSNGALPSFITRCKIDDHACLLSSAKAVVPAFVAGIPELGLKSLDPMNIPLINSDQNGLKLQFKNSTLTGIKTCTIENIKNEFPKMKQSITLKCSFVMTGDYNVNGQILILPIEGEGKYKLDIRDMVIKVHADIEPVTKSGATHWHITKWRQTFKVLTGAKFELENLFNGNKVLGDPVLEFLNTNWKDIMQEIAPPVVQALIVKVVEAVENFYDAVSVDELFLQ